MSTIKITLTEAQAEQILDRWVMAALATDAAYNNAETAEAQAEREDELTATLAGVLENNYNIA